jgi:large subunit ribosomal protein L9
MEVILLEPIKNLGKTGEKVEVKNGFARNYLIPRGVALRANKANLEVFEQRRSEIEKNNGEKKTAAEAQAKKLKGLEVTVIRQAAEDGRLYGSVTVREIAEHIKEKGFEVDSKEVELLNIIKAVGVYNVTINLHAEVGVEVKVNVARSDSEAEGQLKTDKAETAAKAAEAAAAAQEQKSA